MHAFLMRHRYAVLVVLCYSYVVVLITAGEYFKRVGATETHNAVCKGVK